MGAGMRSIVEFACAGETLVGTFDAAPGSTGLLIVSGGEEVRHGAHRGMAILAAALAARGIPVFRFDRRGVGDSSGHSDTSEAYATMNADLVAAAAEFRALAPQVETLVGMGNCDGAMALALFHRNAGIDRLILTNPWVGDEADALPPASAIRAHYAQRLRDPATWLRALKGGVDFTKFFRGLQKTSGKQRKEMDPLAAKLATALGDTPRTVLLARRDNTAARFIEAFPTPAPAETRIELDSASHSFARVEEKAWLFEQILKDLS